MQYEIRTKTHNNKLPFIDIAILSLELKMIKFQKYSIRDIFRKSF